MIHFSKVIRTVVCLTRVENRSQSLTNQNANKEWQKEKELHPPMAFSGTSVYTAHKCPKQHGFPAQEESLLTARTLLTEYGHHILRYYWKFKVKWHYMLNINLLWNILREYSFTIKVESLAKKNPISNKLCLSTELFSLQQIRNANALHFYFKFNRNVTTAVTCIEFCGKENRRKRGEMNVFHHIMY